MKLRVSLVLEPGDDPATRVVVQSKDGAELAHLHAEAGQADIPAGAFGAWAVVHNGPDDDAGGKKGKAGR